MRHALAALLLWLACLPAEAGESRRLPEFGSSITFDKGDPACTVTGLRGRTMLILFGQSWCPICNGWTPDLLKQVEAAFGSDPRLALVLIKTDGDAASGKSYLTSAGANPDRWIVVGDAKGEYMTRTLGDESLWVYSVVDADGLITSVGKCGMYSGSDAKKQFSLAREPLAKLARAVPPGMSATHPAALARAVRFAELGHPLEALTRAQAADAAAFPAFRADLLGLYDRRLAAARSSFSATAPALDRFRALDLTRRLATGLSGSDLAKRAQAQLAEAGRDLLLRKELEAEQKWNEMFAKAARMTAAERAAALAPAIPQFIKAYPGTYFAQIAEEWQAYTPPRPEDPGTPKKR